MIRIALLAIVLNASISQTSTPNRPPLITDYWQHLTQLLTSGTSRAQWDQPAAAPRRPPQREFTFNALNHLKAQDLLRAAREGVRYAQLAGGDEPAGALERRIEENVQTALEFYPLFVEQERDYDRLLYLIARDTEESAFRLYLIRRCTPGLAHKSLFSDYFIEESRRNRDKLFKTLFTVLDRLFENPEVLEATTGALYQITCGDYVEAFQRDPNVIAKTKETGKPVLPISLLAPDAPALTAETRAALDKLEWPIREYTNILLKNIHPDVQRPPQVILMTREFLQRIHDELPISFRDEIRIVLEVIPAPVTTAAEG